MHPVPLLFDGPQPAVRDQGGHVVAGCRLRLRDQAHVVFDPTQHRRIVLVDVQDLHRASQPVPGATVGRASREPSTLS